MVNVVSADPRKNMASVPCILRSSHEQDDETGEPLFWNHEDGWVDRASASIDPYIPGELVPMISDVAVAEPV